MGNRKGPSGEREAAALLTKLLAIPVRRKLGAGRHDDVGDLDGLPNTVIQVANRVDLATALNEKLPATVKQQRNAHARFGAMMMKRLRLGWVVVMTPDQFAALWLEANRRAVTYLRAHPIPDEEEEDEVAE